jgi:hypothetical protein
MSASQQSAFRDGKLSKLRMPVHIVFGRHTRGDSSGMIKNIKINNLFKTLEEKP